jgi:hypothetical protein
MKILIIAAVFSAVAVLPAAAKTKATATACTAENMAKTTSSMAAMPEGPGKMAMSKHMGMVNTEMSKGNMRGACAHYMNVQKMSSAK